jgi:hypothetical protein
VSLRSNGTDRHTRYFFFFETSRRDGAIVAWHEVPGTATHQRPSRRVRCDPCRVRTDSMIENEEISNLKKRVSSLLKETRRTLRREIRCARSYRTLRDGSFEGLFPGTSCQATIGLSLRDRMCSSYLLRLMVSAPLESQQGQRSSNRPFNFRHFF